MRLGPSSAASFARDHFARGRQMIRALRLIGWSVPVTGVAAAAVMLGVAGRLPFRPAIDRGPVPGATLEMVVEGRAMRPMVTSLRTGGPAATAGFAVGDRIEDVDGVRASSIERLRGAAPGDKTGVVQFHVRRGDHIVDVRMKRVIGGSVGEQDPAGRGRYGNG